MNRVYSFGYHKHGQLGRNVSEESSGLPNYVPDLDDLNIRSVICGGAFSVAIDEAGDAFSFGDMRGKSPQLELALKGMKIQKIVCSAMFSLALTKLGHICIWGIMNPHVGLELATPQRLIPDGGGLFGITFIDCAAGALHALLIAKNGDLYAYGCNDDGQLGFDPDALKDKDSLYQKPQRVHFFWENKIKIIKAACGGRHSAVLDSNNRVWVFGSNKYGQLGIGRNTPKVSQPERLSIIYNVTDVVCGDNHTLFVDRGKLYSCGLNNNGQLGLGHTNNVSFPEMVSTLRDYNVLKVAAGGGYNCSHSMVIVAHAVGTLYTFGNGKSGQLGYNLNNQNQIQSTPKIVEYFNNKIVTDIACGWLHSLVLVNEDVSIVEKNTNHLLKQEWLKACLGQFALLPSDILNIFLNCLDAKGLSKLNCTSKLFMRITNDNTLWERLTKKELTIYTNPSNQHWKVLFVNNHLRIYPKPAYNNNKGFSFNRMISGIAGFFGLSNTGFNFGGAIMLGLDAAGKTTIVYKLNLGEIVTTIPTIGFNVEVVHFQNCKITIWDIGGPDKIRPLWRHYYQNTNRLIFVVDSNDPWRMDEAARELEKILQEDELRGIPLLVFANKEDLPGAQPISVIVDKLRLQDIKDRKWYIQSCCAVSGSGLYEGFDWLSSV